MAARSLRPCRWLLRGSENILLAAAVSTSGTALAADSAPWMPDAAAVDSGGSVGTSGLTGVMLADAAAAPDSASGSSPDSAPDSGGDGGGSSFTPSGLLMSAGADAMAAQGGVPLVLNVSVNGVDRGLGRFFLVDGGLWASAAVLRGLGVKTDAEDNRVIPISSLPNTTATYRADLQQVDIMVGVERLNAPRTLLNMGTNEAALAASSQGLLLNYDLYGSVASGSVAANAFIDLRYFNNNSVVETTGIIRGSDQNDGWDDNSVRLDSSWSLSFPNKRLTLRVGDSVTMPARWSRSTRMGGIQLGTNNALQPYLVTAPLASFLGSAVLPSQLDLYINGVKRYTNNVPPGPFEIGAAPWRIDGLGQGQLVLTDAFGRATATNFSFYDTSLLLREGLDEWSVEAGAIRKNYGIKSFDYGNNPFASGTWRRGLTNQLTMEAHGEATDHLANGGLGVMWLAGSFGVIGVSAAASSDHGDMGGLFAARYNWTNSRFRLTAQVTRTTHDYNDLAGRNGAPPLRESDYVQAGYSTRALGSFSFGYANQRYRGMDRTRYATFNWYTRLGRQMAFSLSANQDIENTHRRSLFATLTFTPAPRTTISGSVQADQDSQSYGISAQHSAPPKGGIGWNGSLYSSDGEVSGNGRVSYLSRYGETYAGGYANGDYSSGYVGQRGAIVLMGGGVYPTRSIYDGFALVSTSGVPDVPVKLFNQQVGVTNEEGKLLVTGLRAYQLNGIAIDTTQLPVDLVAADLAHDAVPADRAGSAVNFDIRRIHALVMAVVDAGGKFVEPGSVARYPDGSGEAMVIGYDGQLYLENATAGSQIVVQRPSGSCSLIVPELLAGQVVTNAGDVVCNAR